MGTLFSKSVSSQDDCDRRNRIYKIVCLVLFLLAIGLSIAVVVLALSSNKLQAETKACLDARH